MAFYHLTPEQVLRLRLRLFWLMSQNIDRIDAQKDMRRLTVANASQSVEGAQACRDRLETELGDIVKVPPDQVNAQRDEKGFEELRAMAKQRIG